MACPSCSHSMSKLCDSDGIAYFLCGRCGTVRTQAVFPDQQPTYLPQVYVPKLVDRCRGYAAGLFTTPGYSRLRELWAIEGVAESINPEGQR